MNAIKRNDMTFELYAPRYQYVTLCDDIARNAKAGFVTRTLGICTAGYDLPYENPNDHYLARFMVLTEGPPTGRWVLINIEFEFKVLLFVSDVTQILEFAANLCTVCHFPIETCQCGNKSCTGGANWELTNGQGKVISSSQLLNKYTTGKKNTIFLGLNFQDAQLQSKKTYEQVFSTPTEFEPLVKVLEDVATFFHYAAKSKSITDMLICTGNFVRSFTGRSNVYFMKDLLEMVTDELSSFFQVQGSNHWTEVMSDLYDNYAKCKNSILAERLKKVFNHTIAHCIYHKMGIEVDPVLFDKIEREKIRPNLVNCLTFLDATAALLAFVLKAGRQSMIAGTIEPFFINSDSVSDWLLKAKKLKVNAEFLGNPKAAGFTIYDYLSELSECIVMAKSIAKFLPRNDPEQRLVLSISLELDAIEKRYLSVTAAQALRKQPLGVVVFGDPGVGKTSVVKMLTHYDAIRRKRSVEAGFVFNYCPEDEYMTNFKSYMHTLIIDDAAQHNPGKIQGIDPSVSLIIKAINNVAFCPPQASLDDKGKTPLLIDLCVVTTNKSDLNIPLYYPASYAAMRRLNFHVTVSVKLRYRKKGSTDLDPEKANHDGVYPNYWNFEVSHAHRVDGMVGTFRVEKKFDDVNDFLKYFGECSDAHHINQERFLAEQNDYSASKACYECRSPIHMCSCETTISVAQANRIYVDHYPDPVDIVYSSEDSDIDSDDSIFSVIREQEIRPWRKEELPFKRSRTCSYVLSERFIRKHKDTMPGYSEALKDFAYIYLPELLHKGYKNHEILDDFNNYVTYCMEASGVEDDAIMSDMLASDITSRLNIKHRTWRDIILRFFVNLYFSHNSVRKTVRFFGKYHLLRNQFFRVMRPALVKSENQKYFARKVGQQIDETLGGANVMLKMFLAMITAVASFSVMVKVWTTFRKPLSSKTDYWPVLNKPEPGDLPPGCSDNVACGDVDCYYTTREPSDVQKDEINHFLKTGLKPSKITDNVKDDDPMLVSEENALEDQVKPALQSSDLRCVGKIPPKAINDDKVNVWLGKERSVTSIDFLPNNTKIAKDLCNKLARNSLIFELRASDSGGNYLMEGRLLALSNESFLTNNHSLPHDKDLELVVYFGVQRNTSPSVGCLIKQAQIFRIPERDIAIIKTKSLPALFKDITNNLVKKSFDGVYDGFYFMKNRDGSFSKREVVNIRRSHYNRYVGGIHFNMEVFSGSVQQQTVLGDCGSPLIAETGFGPAIVGFHAVLEGNRVISSQFTHEDYLALCSKMEVQCGRIPVDEKMITLSKKSYIDFHDEGRIMYHGDLLGFRMRPKHHVFETELAEQLYNTEIEGFVIEKRLVGPVMDSWRPQQVSLKEFIKPVDFMDETLLEECVESFFAHIVTNLPESEWDLIHPVPLDVAVNGYPGMAYVDPLKRSTSMGFPWKTTKRKYLIPLDDERWPDGVRFTDEIEKEIFEWYDSMKKGKRCHPIFSANLKDEPVSMKKFLMAKTRVFFSGPAPFLVIVRMMLLGFCRVVQRNPYVFHSAVGMNTHSLEWDNLFRYLVQHGLDTCIAGDYAFYDKKMKMLMLRLAMEFIIKICIKSGNYSEEEILILEVIKFDMINPSVDYFGMLITLLGGEVSGHQLTTILNIIVNILYLSYVYGKCGYDVFSFFDNVAVVALGDDHILTVSERCPLFTHTRIQQEMLHIGVDYTMADKSSDSRPYINLYEGSFLKRVFKYDLVLGVHVAPLDVNSIFKMLTVQVESKTCCKSEQLAQAITSAYMEAFFHGEAFFNALDASISGCSKSFSLEEQQKEYPIFTWKQNVERFWSTDVRNSALVSGRNQKIQDADIYCHDSLITLQSRRSVDHHPNQPARAFPKVRFYGGLQVSKESDTGRWTELSTTLDNQQLADNIQTNMSQMATPSEGDSQKTSQEQTQFVNESSFQSLDLSTSHDPTADDKLIKSQLGTFLSRPTKIATYTWTENGAAGIKTTIKPWGLYFNNANIKNKLQNFKFLRCTLKLKFTINASQFYYGSIGAFYTPLNTHLQSFGGSNTNGIQIYSSQKPHVWLDPQTSSSSEMKLPFLYPFNFIDTQFKSVFDDMGDLELIQYAALRSANGVTTTGVNVIIYAWAEDVELTGATSIPVLQGKKSYGPISGPASTVKNIASKLENVPVIGGFAKATNVVASAIGDVSEFFGFTNVPVVEDVMPFKPTSFHTLSSAHISEPINKLSLQPKQEVSIATDHLGDQFSDQLHIANFCQKESFLTGSLWTTSDPEDKILFTSSVTPELYLSTTGTPTFLYGTPMSHVMSMFTYWRGDVIFRFKVVKSQYHRGRVNICWDVGNNNPTIMPGYGNPSVMNVVFDLETQDEVEIRVPYMQAKPFLRKADMTVYGPNMWDNTGAPAFTARGNGIIQMRVVNRLTAPEASSDVDVLIFVRAAENIEFAAPCELLQNWSIAELQSKKTYDEPESQVCFDSPSVSHPCVYDEVFGEKIVSLRELLHRSSLSCSNIIYKDLNWSTEQMVYTLPIKRLPRSYGYNQYGWESGANSSNVQVPFNFVKNHPINWLASCFVGHTGSVNYTFNSIFNDQKVSRSYPHVSVTRQSYGRITVPSALSTGGSTVSSSQYMRELNTSTNALQAGATGTAVTNQFTQAGLAVNLPYYTNARFLINNVDTYYGTIASLSGTEDDWFAFNLKRGLQSATDTHTVIDTYVGTGPDFNLIFFVCVPPISFLPPPVAKTTG